MSHFKGRSLINSRDLSLDESIYLFEQTRILKKAHESRPKDFKTLEKFQINDPYYGINLLFWEPSTRTKESTWNASFFHNVKTRDVDISQSSVKKSESYYNTLKTLFGYDNNLFVIRSKTEGVCTWLDEKMAEFANRFGRAKPSIVNAGDGKHEHPTQEELDQFTFYERLNGDLSHIHIALIGDLLHGRTVHSKADGLKRYKEVEVDLIAPEMLQMPNSYVEKMKHNGFNVNLFESLDDYYNHSHVAKIQYFTRFQLERMSSQLIEKEKKLRESVTLRKSHLELIHQFTKLYHPQPFDGRNPVIPLFVENTPYNGWDEQSMNGYYWRTVLLSALAGKISDDFKGEPLKTSNFEEDFVQSVNRRSGPKKKYVEGIQPIKNGIVIDHICRGEKNNDIWEHLSVIRSVLNLYDLGYSGVAKSRNDGKYKGIMFMPNNDGLDEKELKMLAAVSPGCTLNVIKDQKVQEKYRLSMPPRIYNITNLSCKNENCITSDSVENVNPEFHNFEDTFLCKYCDSSHTFKEIWKK